MKDILLSIHPNFADAIISGKKKYELRKNRISDEINWIYLYETKPVQKVTARVALQKILTASPKILKTIIDLSETELTSDQYNKYYEYSKIASALVLGRVEQFSKPLPLSDFKISRIPQNYCYLKVDGDKILNLNSVRIVRKDEQ